MGLELNLAVLPCILAAVTKCLLYGYRSLLAYVEQPAGLLYNLRHFNDLNIDLDVPVGIVWRLGYLRFEKLGPPFHIQLLNEVIELLLGAKI